ncbi:Structural maintenance of chromosomes protein 1 [Didymosphaeria variabile]|uniref:Structural maintenance of chromosomes protein n=1 Tax=Didymosphaeria variabile TaxID=1932322 RepID=A0A9W9CD14_9PLEO|nr:Structural maintenance of chromosomes protein 1 [Didymosphaeria variabile]KAJ4357306.1 Structural maintenance of chromosomes protein 1 [Didymosphaeria variabile]
MGKLVRLELYNFKTYRGKHVLPFGDSYFTSIIGPNGSGKSNSMDAISFVLGIKSASLRSRELRELVYRGRIIQTSKTAVDEANGDQNGEADGETQEDGESQQGDPKTAWVEAVFEDDAENIHRWRRTITTAGQSEYRINGRVVTARAYNEALEEQSILVKARAFLIPQGEVEEVAKKPPKDITHMIEQISGSLDKKADYERLKGESDAAAEDNSQFLLRKRQINTEIKTLALAEAEAQAYERKIAERDDATVTHIMWKLYHHQQAIEKARDKISRHAEELKEHRRGVQKYHDRLQDATKEEAKVKRTISKTNNDINAKSKEIEDTQNDLVPVEEKIRLTMQELAKLESRIASLTKDRDTKTKEIAQLDKNIAQVDKAEKQWEAQRRATAGQQGQELSPEDEQEYNRLRSEVSKQTYADQAEVTRLEREIGTEREHARNLQQKIDGFQATVDRLEEEIAQLQERQNELKITLKDRKSTRATKRQDLNKLESDRKRNKDQSDELNQELRKVLSKLQSAEMDRHETNRERALREHVSKMKRTFGSSVYGRYKDLIKPKQRKYDAAIGTLLGWHMDAVLVDTDKTARDCVQFLKEGKLGQMSFLPLDSLTVQSVNQNLKGMHEGMRLGIDCIDYPPHLERAISSACGDSVICDTLKLAQHMCFERKIGVKAVTLDGSVISKGNTMTGGTMHGSNQKQQWGDAEIEALRQNAQKYQTQIASLTRADAFDRDIDELQVELNDLDDQTRRLEDEIKTLDRNISSKQKELTHDKNILRQEKPKLNDVNKRLSNREQDLEEKADAVHQVEDTVFAAFCSRLGYANIREYDSQQGSAQQEASQKRLEFRKQRTTLEFMRKNIQQQIDHIDTRILTAQAKLDRDQAALDGHKAQREELQNTIDELQAELETLQEKLAALEKDKSDKSQVVKDARAKLDKRNEKVRHIEADVQQQEIEIKNRASERYSLLKKCRLEEIEIPLTSDSVPLKSLPMTDAVRQQDPDAMDVDEPDETQAEIEDYGIEPDFEKLDEELREEIDDILAKEDSDDDKIQAEAAAALKKTEDQLIDQIVSLDVEINKATPNMKASERLAVARDKLHEIDEDFKTAKRKAEEAKAAFETIKDERMELFMKAYDHIHDNIKPVYMELTKSSQFPMGGTAYLDLEDSSEPYLAGIKYNAMPPLKRFRDMEHLSGGERTIAALALIFAIHSYQPSPFFVLDEVDAALDNVNVARVARYVTSHARPGMQFIVISHKAGLFQESETLVGIMRDQAKMSSKAISLDLRKYPAAAAA